MEEGSRIIIIGGTACGPKAAARARRCDPDAEITIIEQNPNISSATCGLPYYVSGVIESQSSLLVRGASYFGDVLNIEVLTRTTALSIDRRLHKVELVKPGTNSPSSIEYDKLVLATGGKPLIPDLKGIKLGGIFTLSTIADAHAIRKYINPDIKKATIIGAGLIGMEMAEAFASLGIQVTVIDLLNWLLPTLLDFEMAAYVERYAKSKGIRFRYGQKVVGFEGNSEGFVSRVITENDVIESDMVLLAVGVRPNNSLAKETGLDIGPRGGISVNQYLQTSDPAIYAGGDCVENVNLITGKNVLAPLGSTANKHGRIIGSNVTGGNETFPGILGTAVAKIFDCNVARVGLTELEAGMFGYEIVTCLVPGQDHASYYPDYKEIIVKLIVDRNSNKILGGQVVGPGEAAKRIDVLATAMTFGSTVNDLANIDLAYAPPYNNAMDPLHNAANVIRNKQSGMAKAISPKEVKNKFDKGEDFILLDVRTEEEWENNHIEAPQSKLIPLDKLWQYLDELPKNAEIITCCQASVRAYQAHRILKGAGFKNVKFVDGSLAIWPYESTGLE